MYKMVNLMLKNAGIPGFTEIPLNVRSLDNGSGEFRKAGDSKKTMTTFG